MNAYDPRSPQFTRYDEPVPEGTPHGYTYKDGIKHGNVAGYERGYQEGIRVNRVPVWRRILHYGIPVVALIMGLAVGSTMHSTPSNTIPTQPAPTRASSAQADTKTKALDRLYEEAKQRASLSHLTEEQLANVMDTFVCKAGDDLTLLGSGGQGISGADAGYLWGANAVIGYC